MYRFPVVVLLKTYTVNIDTGSGGGGGIPRPKRVRLGRRTPVYTVNIDAGFGGGGGIRTPDPAVRDNGFQDRRLQPLGHSSVFNCNLQKHLAAHL